MCGRTANNLQAGEIVNACSWAVGKRAKQGEKTGGKKAKQGKNGKAATKKIGKVHKVNAKKISNTKKLKSKNANSENNFVPIWNEAPCGGKFIPSPNIPPTSYTPVMYMNGEGKTTIQPMMWNLIPSWHQGPDPNSHKLRTTNCRIENLLTSRLYKPCLSKRRCVVVCQGFYEWHKTGGTKQPYFVYKPEEKVIFLAGLYSQWKDVCSFTIVTKDSAKDLAWMHHRMPVILEDEQIMKWLDASLTPSEAVALLKKPQKTSLKWHKVSPDVGNIKNQDPMIMTEMKEENMVKDQFGSKNGKRKISSVENFMNVRRNVKKLKVA